MKNFWKISGLVIALVVVVCCVCIPNLIAFNSWEDYFDFDDFESGWEFDDD